MTSISALENIHKRGLFGDHQGKDKNELTNISEVKHLQIIQNSSVQEIDYTNCLIKSG